MKPQNITAAILGLLVAAFALIGLEAVAAQRDTNTTTTITNYTPVKPGDLLVGAQGGTGTAWVATGQTTNDWKKITP